tara:strand:+ start:431 stop:661 length:231 start_codon:yes stop_codon:yes gene_type:complete
MAVVLPENDVPVLGKRFRPAYDVPLFPSCVTAIGVSRHEFVAFGLEGQTTTIGSENVMLRTVYSDLDIPVWFDKGV